MVDCFVSFPSFQLTMLVPSGIGYSLPLLLLCAALSVWCGVLLAPWPFNKPGIEFARLTWTKTGTTVGALG